jgi:hypothetical protein
MNKQLYIKKIEYCLTNNGGGMENFGVSQGKIWRTDSKMNMAMGSSTQGAFSYESHR